MDADSRVPQPMGNAPPELVALLRDGYRPLMRTAMYAGASEGEAHDAIQEASIEVAKRWGTIDEPMAYLRRAVVNNLRKIWRSEERRKAREIEHLARSFERPPDEPNIWADGDAYEEMLSKLTPGQHDIVRGLLKGLTQAEVAEVLGRSRAAVRSALTDMRRRLRAAGYEPGAPCGTGDIARRDSGHSAREEDR